MEQIFTDPQFDATAYVDAIYAQVSKGQIDKYTPESLAALLATSLELVTQLDCHLTELAGQLASKIEALKRPSALVTSLHADSMTRLQFYLDSLRNSVDTLQGDLDAALKQVEGGSGPVQDLVALQGVKERINAVLEVLRRVCDLVLLSRSVVTVSEFQTALESLHEKATDKAKTGEPIKEELQSFEALFQGFSKFAPLYRKCLTRVSE